MIAKASSINHGHAAVNYVVTKRDAVPLRVNRMNISWLHGREFVASEVCDAMRETTPDSGKPGRKLGLHFIRVEIAPTPDEAETLKTKSDWLRLLDDWIEEMEKPFTPDNGKRKNKDTRLSITNSKYIAAVHNDSGKPHIHLIVNRVDDYGHTNYARQIGRRAVEAANRVNARRGWKQSQAIHDERVDDIARCANDVLAAMPKFSWPAYVRGMQRRGYNVKLRKDKEGKVVGYRVGIGNSSYKASEIGAGKHLTAAHIFTAWLKLHPEAQYDKQEGKGNTASVDATQKLKLYSDDTGVKKEEREEEEIVGDFLGKEESFVSVPNNRVGGTPWLMPREAYEAMEHEVGDYYAEHGISRDDDNRDTYNKVLSAAAEIFSNAQSTGSLTLDIIDAATDATSIGGGGVHGELSQWGGNGDDDLTLARRAGRAACHGIHGRRGGRSRSGGRRR